MFMLFAIYADKQALDVLASMGYGTAKEEKLLCSSIHDKFSNRGLDKAPLMYYSERVKKIYIFLYTTAKLHGMMLTVM